MSKITYSTLYTEGLSDNQVSDDFEATLSELRSSGPIRCPHLVASAVRFLLPHDASFITDARLAVVGGTRVT